MIEQILTQGSIPLILAGLLAAGVGIPLPEDGLLLAAGVMTHRNAESWIFVLGAAYFAVLAADSLIFAAGYIFGDAILKRRPFSWVATPDRRDRVGQIFEERGAFAVFVGRFITGMRGAIFITAGTQRMSYRTFLFWDALAAMITIPIVFGLGFLFHSRLDVVKDFLATAQTSIAIGAALLLAGGLYWRARKSRAEEALAPAPTRAAPSHPTSDTTPNHPH